MPANTAIVMGTTTGGMALGERIYHDTHGP
jgi:hypothetical protein